MQLPDEPRDTKAWNSGKNPLDDEIRRIAHETLRRWRVPGLALGVIDGENAYSEGYGISDLDGTPVTRSTNFYAGSTTKAFTAAALSLLVADAKYPEIQWTTPVNRLIRDDFVTADGWATDHLTLEDLLSHRTGLPSHDQSHGPVPSVGEPHHGPLPEVREVVRRIRYLPFTAEPRSMFQYCNMMFIAASHVLETATSQWLGLFLRERIWKPLGMMNTYFSTEDAKLQSNSLSKGYKWDEYHGKFTEIPWMNLDATSGAGSIISNVEDYNRWAYAVVNETAPLTEEDWTAITSPRSIPGKRIPLDGTANYALGWYVGTYRGHRVLEHTGGMNAFGADVIVFPDLKYAVVGMGNTAGSSVFAEQLLLWSLVDDRLGTPADQRVDWNQRNQGILDDGKQKAHDARQRLYPSLPDPTLPLSLPLEAYTGSYVDLGYQTLNIEISSDKPSPFLMPFLRSASGTQIQERIFPKCHLVASRSTFVIPEYITFQHISGDFFIAWVERDADYGAWWPDAYPVEFRVGADGKIGEVGIKWEERLGQNERIWLKKPNS